LFTVIIDFGPGVFTGMKYWMQIEVESNRDTSFTTLTPRQELTPVPYAIFAETASNLLGTLPASQLSSIGNTNGGYNDNFFVGPSGNTTTKTRLTSSDYGAAGEKEPLGPRGVKKFKSKRCDDLLFPPVCRAPDHLLPTVQLSASQLFSP